MKEFTTQEAKRLATQIRLNYKSGLSPVLFLGAGASVESGLPSSKGFFEHISGILESEISNLNDLHKLLQSDTLRKLFIQNYVHNTPSRGYKLLAQLVRKGFFSLILTTNWDLILEVELRKWFNTDEIFVSTRPIDRDELIAGRIRENNILNLVRLHGDLNTQLIYEPDQLMKVNQQLMEAIKNEINKRGILFIGYGLGEPRIINIVEDAEFIGYVNPDEGSLINSLSDKKVIPIVGSEDSYFDNFMEGLVRTLLKDYYKERILCSVDKKSHIEKPDFSKGRLDIDRLIDELKSKYNEYDYSESAVEELSIRLLNQIKKRFFKSNYESVCLLFVHDVEAPGGTEVLNVLKRRKMLENLGVSVIKIEGRGTDDRHIVEFYEEDLSGFDSVVIIDSITFSGNTMNIVRDHICAKYNLSHDQIAAALMVLSHDAEQRLINSGWKTIFKGGVHTGLGLVWPWGVTSPTKPIYREIKSNSPSFLPPMFPVVEEFWVSHNFGFIPKPWGDLIDFRNKENVSVKMLSFNRGQRTSLHYHLLRDEMFFSLEDRVRIQLWDRFLVLGKHEAIRIPAGVPHCLIALEHHCRVLEIGEGLYDQKADIFRLEDIHNRPGLGLESNGMY